MLTLAGILIFSFVRVPQKEVHAQETVVSNTENSCERIVMNSLRKFSR